MCRRLPNLFLSKDFSRWVNGMDLNEEIDGLPNRAITLAAQPTGPTHTATFAALHSMWRAAMTVVYSF
jgi:hypothetical protein